MNSVKVVPDAVVDTLGSVVDCCWLVGGPLLLDGLAVVRVTAGCVTIVMPEGVEVPCWVLALVVVLLVGESVYGCPVVVALVVVLVDGSVG